MPTIRSSHKRDSTLCVLCLVAFLPITPSSHFISVFFPVLLHHCNTCFFCVFSTHSKRYYKTTCFNNFLPNFILSLSALLVTHFLPLKSCKPFKTVKMLQFVLSCCCLHFWFPISLKLPSPFGVGSHRVFGECSVF